MRRGASRIVCLVSSPSRLPGGLHLKGIVDFRNRVDFGRKLLNSFVISGVVAVGGVVVSLLNAYALGIGRVRGRIWFLIFFLVANLLPQESLVYRRSAPTWWSPSTSTRCCTGGPSATWSPAC